MSHLSLHSYIIVCVCSFNFPKRLFLISLDHLYHAYWYLFLPRLDTSSARSPSPMTSYSRCARRTSRGSRTRPAPRATPKQGAQRRAPAPVSCGPLPTPRWPQLKTTSTGIISRSMTWCHHRLRTRSVITH